MQKVIIKVGGMSCSACSNHVEKYLKKSEGVLDASVNLVLGQALIEYEDELSLEQLKEYIVNSGYDYLGVYDEKEESKIPKRQWIPLVLLGILGFFLMYVSMAHMLHLPIFSFWSMEQHPVIYSVTLFLLTIPYFIYAFDILKKGIKNLVHWAPNMDTLVTIGVLFSFFYSTFNMILVCLGHKEFAMHLYFESSAIVLLFIKIGRYIDGKATEKTKEAIKQLVQITPQKAYLKDSKGIKEVTIDEVKKNDILVCKPGMKVAVDGIITKGTTHFDEAFITGESKPSRKTVGSTVVAGAMNLDGYIEYKAVRIGKDSTISEIVRLVLEASNTKAPIARFADRVSGYFVPAILLIAVLTFFGSLFLGIGFEESVVSFVTVLVVACPCALGLATPLAIVVSEGLCAKKGILVKSGAILETAHTIDTVVFDKTGTLTYGDLRISKIYDYGTYSEEELLRKVASLEAKSSHPIATAFAKYAKEKNLRLDEVSNFKNLEGIGLVGELSGKKIAVGNGSLFPYLKIKNSYSLDEEKLAKAMNSIIYVIEENTVIALLGVKDIVRENAKEVVSKLTKLNRTVILLSGDHVQTSKLIGNSLGIKTVVANVTPQEKTKYIQQLKSKNKHVMMIGDGINDAPSLASADLGVSIHSGTDIALDSADVILMNDNLEKIVLLLLISQKTIRIIKQNLFWAFLYNVLMIPIAIGLLKPFGIMLNPMLASLAMTLSSLTVVFNSLRLRKIKNIH